MDSTLFLRFKMVLNINFRQKDVKNGLQKNISHRAYY